MMLQLFLLERCITELSIHDKKPVGMYEIHGMKGRGEQHVPHNT